MKAQLNNYRQSPRKVRLVTDLVKGKSAVHAQAILSRLIKRGALPIKKLLDSAVANSGVSASELVVKNATVDKGVVIKRWMPRAMGRAFPIHKHTSKVVIELATVESQKSKVKSIESKKLTANG
jgi:large subunit ribosomal protein L22